MATQHKPSTQAERSVEFLEFIETLTPSAQREMLAIFQQPDKDQAVADFAHFCDRLREELAPGAQS
jgi:hypothetical protein